MVSVLGLWVAPSAADPWAPIYSADFSSDPGWITNVPDQMFWDATSGRFYVESRAGSNQYVYVPIPAIGGKSFRLDYDLTMVRADYAGGVSVGLSDGLELWGTTAGVWANYGSGDGGAGGTVGYRTDSVTFGFFPGPYDFLFSIPITYHYVLTFDSQLQVLRWEISANGQPVANYQSEAGIGVFPGIDRLVSQNNNSGGGTAAGYLDNVVLSILEEGCESNASGLLLYQSTQPSQYFLIRSLKTGIETAVPLPPAGLGYWTPQWCANGEWIVFSGADIAHNSHIFVSRPDGTGFAKLTSGGGNYVMPGFSPDCSKIVFHGVYGQTYIINRDGSDWIDLGATLGHTRWSPVDNRIVGTNWGFTYESDIFLFDMDQETTTQVTHHNAGEYFNYASWSPDGTKLAVAGAAGGTTYDIFLLNDDGTGLINLTGDWTDSDEHYPSWSSDGQFIFFTKYGSDGHHDTWAMQVDGTSRSNLTNTANVDEFAPAILGSGGNVDSDGDGFDDCEDWCPDSDMSETIGIGQCETGVDNELFDGGCSMMDLIGQCADGAGNHGEFVSCVSLLAAGWAQQGEVSGTERGRIMRCVARNKGKVNFSAAQNGLREDSAK